MGSLEVAKLFLHGLHCCRFRLRLCKHIQFKCRHKLACRTSIVDRPERTRMRASNTAALQRQQHSCSAAQCRNASAPTNLRVTNCQNTRERTSPVGRNWDSWNVSSRTPARLSPALPLCCSSCAICEYHGQSAVSIIPHQACCFDASTLYLSANKHMHVSERQMCASMY